MLFRSKLHSASLRCSRLRRERPRSGHCIRHDPNRVATVQFMLLMKYGDVGGHGVSIETMKFDGWRVVR